MGKNGFQVADENTIVLVGRPWRVRGERRPDVASFETFKEPRYARLLIRPFSGLTRRSWLQAAKRRAEAIG